MVILANYQIDASTFHGIDTLEEEACSVAQTLMMVFGLFSVFAPFIGYIPFPYFEKFGHIFNPKLLIPWFFIHGLLCLFMTGYIGLITGILCFITTGLGIVGIFRSFYDSQEKEETY
ncbi:hypothetical protein QTN25_008114 [Entamoeba marina]